MTDRSRARGFTLIELLAVIAIIVLVMALAVPNFASMIRAQRWQAAISALQNALFRTRTYAVNERYDHSIEFCESEGEERQQYFRIECESAFLEGIPELNNYLHNVVRSYIHRLPIDWYNTFKNSRGVVQGYVDQGTWLAQPSVRFVYNGPIEDVDRYGLKDNLKVDDHIFLPHDIKVDFKQSKNLINYDKKPESDQDSPQYGWDETPDLRFNVAGVLIQARNPEVVLVKESRRPEQEHIRLQVLRSTARLRRMRDLP
jgi:prepilin-type N-terminal cleavage/methylation domain-containing protein